MDALVLATCTSSFVCGPGAWEVDGVCATSWICRSCTYVHDATGSEGYAFLGPNLLHRLSSGP